MQKIIECGSIEEIGRRGLQEEGLKLVNSKGGHERLAKGIAEFMDSHPGESFVLDGLRYPQTYEELKKIVNKPITVIYIENTIDNLFKYYQDRDSSETSFSEFLEIVHHPVEREIERFLPIANIVVYNHDVRKPGERMPVARIQCGERPHQVLAIQAGLHTLVFGHVKRIVVGHESVLVNRPIRGEGGGDKQQADDNGAGHGVWRRL
jgi:hypothetical protein